MIADGYMYTELNLTMLLIYVHVINDRSVITKMPNLLAACSTGAGYEVINVDDCTEAGIIVCNQSGANSTAVSEHVFGIMISLSKK